MEKKRDDASKTDSEKKSDATAHQERATGAATDEVTDVKLANETSTGPASSSDTARDGKAGQHAGATPVPPLTDTDNPEAGKSNRGPIIGAIVVVAAIAAGGYYYAQNNQLVSADNGSQSSSESASPTSDASSAQSASGADNAPGTDSVSGTDNTSGADNAGQAPAASSPDTNTSGASENETSSASSSDAAGSGDTATDTQQPADANATSGAETSAQSGVAGSTTDIPAGPAADHSDGTGTDAAGANDNSDTTQDAASPAADAGSTAQEQAGGDSEAPHDEAAASGSAGHTDSTSSAQAGAALTNSAAPAAAGGTGALPADIRDQLDRQSAQIIALRDQLESSQKQLAQLQSTRLQASRHEASVFVLNDVSRLVTMAQNELAISGNLENAVASLETARKAIDQADAPVLAGLQGALAADIVALKSAPVVGVDTLFSQVSALSERIDALPMIAPDQAGARPMAASSTVTGSDAQATQNADSSTVSTASDVWYERAWNEVKTWPASAWHGLRSDLGGIVRVEKLADPNQVLLTVDQAGQLRANLKQNLHFAQQALLNGQQGIWTASLETVLKGLKQSFNQDSSDIQQALAQVQQLLKTGVRPQMPAITQSVKAVDETRNQLKSMNPGQE